MPPSDVLVAIEIAVSSLAYDTGRKSQVNAALGVPEYWVIDATKLATRIHREVSADGYRSITEAACGETLVPHLVTSVSVNLADLGID